MMRARWRGGWRALSAVACCRGARRRARRRGSRRRGSRRKGCRRRGSRRKGSRRKDLAAGDLAARDLAAGDLAAGDLAAGDLAAGHAGLRRGAAGHGSARRPSWPASTSRRSSVRGTTADSAVAAVRADQRPRDQHRRGRLHLGRRRLRRRALRGGSPGRLRPAIRPRTWISTSPTSAPIPAPNLLHRGDAQINEDVTLYTVFFFHAAERTVGVAVSRSTPPPAAPPRWRSPRIRRSRAGSSSPAPPAASRPSARASGDSAPGAATDASSTTTPADDWVERTFAHEAVLRRLQARGARGLLPGSPELHARRDAGRSVRHPPARLAERDREPVRRRSRTRAGCSRRSSSSRSIRWRATRR